MSKSTPERTALGSIPVDPLEPCRRGRRSGRSQSARVAGGPLQCLLVSALRLYQAAGLFERAGTGSDAGFLYADSGEGPFRGGRPGRGRFRSFLRTVCSHYLANRRATERALKRGGGRPAISIDAADAEGRYARELAHELTAERIFDRSWALTLLDRVFNQLRSEYEDAGRAETFEALQVFLTEGPRAVSHASIARRLGMTEGAVRVAVHRLRRRYGDILRREIAATLDDPSQIDDEIQGLFTALET